MKPLYSLLFFAIGSLLIAFLYQDEMVLTAVVAIGCIAVLEMDRWKNLKKFLVAVAVGGACENIAVWLGGWGYANAGFLFTPLWLPLGWGFSVLLLEESFAKNAPAYFSWKAVLLAFAGTVLAALASSDEGVTLFLFSAFTLGAFRFGFYSPLEIKAGVAAAILGTAMEGISIWTGNWQYPVAMLGVPLWLPLCWMNAFLIMRRIIRI